MGAGMLNAGVGTPRAGEDVLAAGEGMPRAGDKMPRRSGSLVDGAGMLIAGAGPLNMGAGMPRGVGPRVNSGAHRAPSLRAGARRRVNMWRAAVIPWLKISKC